MNPAVLFLVGGAALAAALSSVVWLFSRPKRVIEDPNQVRANLRALREGVRGGSPLPKVGNGGPGGIRVLGAAPAEGESVKDETSEVGLSGNRLPRAAGPGQCT
ncbi:MAG: hypothetical protein P8M16_03515 [Acidimicrobiales bacterium]|nr:hypothetical protein [Acidimicrobiales bacterium]